MNMVNEAVAAQIPMPPKACKNTRKIIELARAARTQKMIKKRQILFESGFHGYLNKG